MRIPFVDLKEQYQNIKGEVLSEMSQVLDSMQLFLGKNVQALETEFADYCGTDYAIGVSSGTDALHIALRAGGVGPGDEVITVSHTFIATVEAIVLAGAKPVLVDIDPETFNMDPSLLQDAITSKTKAVIPVYMYGHPANMDPIIEIARNNSLKIIEDACQAHGSEYKGRRAGSMGDLGCFSFYFTKNLGAYGEGGIITTSDPDLARSCRMIRDHGQNEKYHHALIGLNGRLDELQAAVLRIKLPHLEEWIGKRRRLARAFDEGLTGLLLTPREMPWAKHVYHLYVVRTPERDQLREWLESRGIGTGMHYPVPVHLQQAWRAAGGDELSLPITERITKEIISLPMYPELTLEQAEIICSDIREFVDSKLGIKAER